MHTKSSNNEINLNDLINKYINNDSYLIICANKNIYSEDNIKYNIADKFVNIKIQYYIDVIKNSKEIHVIDSCFSCIVYPLNKTNRLAAQVVNIIRR
jgi:spore maturation protein SpmB